MQELELIERVSEDNINIATDQALTKFSSLDQGITAISFSLTNLTDISSVTALIEKHHTTLESIVLLGPRDKTDQSLQIELLFALTQCQNLTQLSIENFATYFISTMGLVIQTLLALPHLKGISFKNTYLGECGPELASGLANSTSLTVLNLSDSDVCSLKVFSEQGIAKNRSLQTLIFGSTPIHSNIKYLYDAVVFSASNIQEVKWQPPSNFDQNTKVYIQMLISKKSPTADFVPFAVRTMSTYGLQLQAQQYDIACQKLASLKAALNRRCRLPSGKTRLTVTLQNKQSYRFDLACEDIILEKDTLTQLTLTFPIVDDRRILMEDADKKVFMRVLTECQNLQELHIINAQGYFGGYTSEIIKQIAELPKLKILILMHTYLGEKGAEALSALIKKNLLVELHLNHVGFINANCFIKLTQVLWENTSLIRINLGSSPMTLHWIRIIANFVFHSDNKTLKKIEWAVNNLENMKKSVLRTCEARNKFLFVNDDLATYYQQFCQQPIEYLKNHWGWLEEILNIKISPLSDTKANLFLMIDLFKTLQGNKPETKNQQEEKSEERIPLKVSSQSFRKK